MSTVIRSPNWIGDGVMCLPAIRAWKNLFPAERLAVAARRYLADIFQNIPEIDEVIALPQGHAGLAGAGALREKRFGRGILFTNSFSSALLFRLAGIHSLAGYASDGRGWMLSDKVARADDAAHHQFYYLNIVERLAGHKAGGAFPANLVVTRMESEQAGAWLQELGIAPDRPLLALAPTAAYGSAKAWLPARFRAFVQAWTGSHADAAVLLFGAASERAAIAELAAGLPGTIRNLAGSLDLRRAIAVLSRCRLFVGNDSGLMHVAAALSVPLVAVFGPTEPGRTAPLAARFRLLHHGADCAPCRHRECPSDRRCMAAVSVAEVLAAADELWAENA